MEKKRPHYVLKDIQAQMVSINGLRMTLSARNDALRAGVTMEVAIRVIQSLGHDSFYKSMTTYHDSKIWQDVYHAKWRRKSLYIKFQKDESGYFTISFKEL